MTGFDPTQVIQIKDHGDGTEFEYWNKISAGVSVSITTDPPHVEIIVIEREMHPAYTPTHDAVLTGEVAEQFIAWIRTVAVEQRGEA